MRYVLILLLLLTSLAHGQQTEVVDFIELQAVVTPDASEESIKGSVAVKFEILKPTSQIFLDAVDMSITEVVLKEGTGPSEVKIEAISEENKIQFKADFRAGEVYTISFKYNAKPKQTLYFVGDQIWTQGQGKYTSHWLPSLDDMNDKMVFDLGIVAPKEKTVIANGLKLSVEPQGADRLWQFDMVKPMPSYLVAMAIGDYQKSSFYTASDVKIELYMANDDKEKAESTYRYTKDIFEFLENEIGIPYPWQDYKQVPVRDFLYAGMENTAATFFSEAFVVDSTGFNDRSYTAVNAHELAHQWFGNLVTETESTHHWLHEGFATYYALLAEREIYGADHYYWKLFNSAEQLQSLSDEGKGESLLDGKASSLTFYEKGAWALHMLRETIGDVAFRTAVKNYLEKYAFKNVTTQDFLTEVQAATTVDISGWKQDWLEQTAFKAEQAYESLKRSDFMLRYFQLVSLREQPIESKVALLRAAIISDSDFLGQEAVFQLDGSYLNTDALQLLKLALKDGNLYTRQAIALSPNMPIAELQPQYEQLLLDASYITQEAMLYNLFVAFPQKRSTYLDKMADVVGFQNKNVRQLWLVLALADPVYKPFQKENFRNELLSYTSPDYSFEVREVALGYVNELNLWDLKSLRNLVNACVHHTWRFRSNARSIMDLVLQKPEWVGALKSIEAELPEKELNYLKSKW